MTSVNQDLTFCIFGDSVTQAAYIKDSWVELFRKYLEKKLRGVYVNVFNLGIGGNTTNDVFKRFKQESMFRTPSHIVFAIGVNDSGYYKTPNKPIVSENKFKNNIKRLIKEAKKLTTNITFVGLVLGDDSVLKPFPESSLGESYDLSRVEKYNRILKELAEANSCKFIQLLDRLDPDDFLDGLHPNDNGHKKIFEEIKKYF